MVNEYRDYRLAFGGEEYVLESNDGGQSGSVYTKNSTTRSVPSYAYLYGPDNGVNTGRVVRFGKSLAGPGQFTITPMSEVN